MRQPLNAHTPQRWVNGLMYALQFPTSERGATTRLLLPPQERKGLADSRGRRSKAWRRAVRRIIQRQRSGIRGGAGFDDFGKVGQVYGRATGQAQ